MADIQKAFKALAEVYEGFVYENNHLYIEYIDDTGTVNEDDAVDAIVDLLIAIGIYNVRYIFDYDLGRYMIYDSDKEEYDYDDHNIIVCHKSYKED